MLQELLNTISEEYGTERFIPDDNGAYSLMCDGIELSIVPAGENQALLYSDLATEPEAEPGELARVVLQVNYLFKGGEGATFAIDPERRHYVLQQLVQLTDADDLSACLEHFLSLTERWSVLIAQYEPGKTQESEASAENKQTPDDGLAVPTTWLAV